MVRTLFISIISLMFLHNLMATEWGDIDSHDYFAIKNDLALDNGVILPKGKEYKYIQHYGLPYINVIVFEFDNLLCTDMSYEMDSPALVLPERDFFVRDALDCIFEVYVEAKDYYTEGFFTESRL